MERPRGSARQVAANISLMLATLLVGLAVAEVAFAVLGAFPPARRLYPGDRDPGDGPNVVSSVGWVMTPNQTERAQPEHGDFDVIYASNSWGFRDSSEFDVPHDGPRIAFIGNSFTFGNGVEFRDTFALLVEGSLPGARSYNFGISGYGIDQMWMALRHFAARIEPDLIVVTFVESNLSRSLHAYRLRGNWLAKPAFRLRLGELEEMTVENRPGSLARWIERNSRLLAGWRRLEHRLSQRFPIGQRWRLNRALFLAIRDEAATMGVPLVVVYLPRLQREWDGSEMLRAEFAEMEIDFVDLTPQFAGRWDALFFPHDRHINEEGHAVVASAIMDHVRQNGLLEPAVSVE